MQLTRKVFESWLKGFEPDAVVGRAAVADECPIANCYRHFYPERWVEVYQDYLEVDGCQKPHTKWSKAFVDKVDRHGYRACITAREALRLLTGR